MFEEQISGIEFRVQQLAQKIRRIEAEKELLKQENEALKAHIITLEEQAVPMTDPNEQEKDWATAVENARKTKRELEMYLREMEKRIADLRF